MTSPTTYLLDTNILVLLIRGKAAGQAIAVAYGLRTVLSRCIISVVTVGEIKAFARKQGWGVQKLTDLDALLAQVVTVDINHALVLDAYAELDANSEAIGRKMGKNDLWIAATARVTGVTLLTIDADFDHLHPADITRIKIDPQTGAAIS
jgi:predicted nucleic acid-binding protein